MSIFGPPKVRKNYRDIRRATSVKKRRYRGFMTREELQAVLDNEETDTNTKITTILNQVNSERQTAVNEERLNSEKVQLQLKESNEALTKLKKANAGNADLQKTIDELTASQERLQKEYDDLKIDSAIKLALTETGAKNVKIAALALDKDCIKLDKEGELIGLNEQIERLKKDESTSFLFEQEKEEPKEPVEEKRPSYSPVKGDKPIQKTQGAELGDQILAERKAHQDMVKGQI